ncbi:hypothetical protein ACOMHN_062399 [Nucella lapillus]
MTVTGSNENGELNINAEDTREDSDDRAEGAVGGDISGGEHDDIEMLSPNMADGGFWSRFHRRFNICWHCGVGGFHQWLTSKKGSILFCCGARGFWTSAHRRLWISRHLCVSRFHRRFNICWHCGVGGFHQWL